MCWTSYRVRYTKLKSVSRRCFLEERGKKSTWGLSCSLYIFLQCLQSELGVRPSSSQTNPVPLVSLPSARLSTWPLFFSDSSCLISCSSLFLTAFPRFYSPRFPPWRGHLSALCQAFTPEITSSFTHPCRQTHTHTHTHSLWVLLRGLTSVFVLQTIISCFRFTQSSWPCTLSMLGAWSRSVLLCSLSELPQNSALTLMCLKMIHRREWRWQITFEQELFIFSC